MREPRGDLRERLVGDVAAQIIAGAHCHVLVAGWQAPEGEDALSVEALRVLDLLLKEMPLKRAAALAAEITGVRKNLLYQAALERQKDA